MILVKSIDYNTQLCVFKLFIFQEQSHERIPAGLHMQFWRVHILHVGANAALNGVAAHRALHEGQRAHHASLVATPHGAVPVALHAQLTLPPLQLPLSLELQLLA